MKKERVSIPKYSNENVVTEFFWLGLFNTFITNPYFRFERFYYVTSTVLVNNSLDIGKV